MSFSEQQYFLLPDSFSLLRELEFCLNSLKIRREMEREEIEDIKKTEETYKLKCVRQEIEGDTSGRGKKTLLSMLMLLQERQ